MPAPVSKNLELAQQLRQQFVTQAAQGLTELPALIQERLLFLIDQGGNARETQERHDAWLAFRDRGAIWAQGTKEAWKKALTAVATEAKSSWDSSSLALLDDSIVEDKILASRLALSIADLAGLQFNDLRLRVQSLDGGSDLEKDDLLRPETLAKHMLEQWTLASLSRNIWLLVQDLVQLQVAEHLAQAYHAANAWLVQQGVMVDIDLRPLLRRTAAESSLQSKLHEPSVAVLPNTVTAPVNIGIDETELTGVSPVSPSVRQAIAQARHATQEETRMQTGTTPLARARLRAQGMLGQLKRLLPDVEATQAQPLSAQLEQAFTNAAAPVGQGQAARALAQPDQVNSPAQVQQVAGVLHQQTRELKKAAATSGEKATIEIVALMFQSILAEERITPAIRVWFARLQMPVLRVAVAEPEFFGSLEHPARRLIDRMGSCVLGFDVTIAGGAMQAEVRRVVQMIEQYPETGRRAFAVAYEEFQKFLSTFLTEPKNTARAVSVAQQVEQKETLVIQYTIELRNMINDIAVRDEIREFLFTVWAEVLALATMQRGPQHEETIKLKQAVADLIWAASAKPDRKDRAQVMAAFPKQLALLRQGMDLLGLDVPTQEQHVKRISETLADAFMSRTELIQPERIAAIAKRLINLEDYLCDNVTDLQIDGERLVTMVGLDSADIQVITDGGSRPSDAMCAWVNELQLGTWFSLDHNGQLHQVQLVWCSERKRLYSFAATDGGNFLIQAGRLAAYLQAGLIVPVEEETLTVRATRDALAKLDANPERLLN